MKAIIISMLLILSVQNTSAQILEKLGQKAADAVERTLEDRVTKESSEKTDKVLDGLL